MSKVPVNGAVVFITGANRKKGIGRALVEEAVRRGAKKVYATARDVSTLDDLVAKHGEVIVPLELDVTKTDHVHQVAKEAGDTQILINNAGLAGYIGGTNKYDEQIARKEMDVNFFGPLNLMNAFADHIKKNQNGAIVNVVSIAGLTAFPSAATYSASKAALFSMTQAVRMEMHEHGVSVFGVYPGPIDTDMADGFDVNKETPENVAKRIYDGMAAGMDEITTDSLADHFKNYLIPDPEAMEAVQKEFG